MKWRLVGPFRAGWATMAEGVKDSLNTYYFGAAGGGVWKTNDAGRTWKPLMQNEKSSSIGAIAVSNSNANYIYAGTGQVAVRYDILSGDGVYRSTNAGNTWKNIGLKDTRHIGRILIDPQNPQRVLAAALGHVFEPNNERGVFLTTNGGKDWKKVLYLNDSTGAVDLAWDIYNPEIVYAAMWQMQMHPWLDYFMPQRGMHSGIYKSEDSGKTWQKINCDSLPNGMIGRIGVAVAPGSNGRIVYASIDAEKSQSGLYRSSDAGKTWKLVNDNGALANSYFSRITVDPDNPDIVYVMGLSISRSEDGGKTLEYFKGAPGGDDYHFLWINPSHPENMITASDQGCVVTVNGGQSWSSWYNQPTGQFYHVAADDQFPYKIYSGQQDNGTVGIFNRGPYGVIELRDWHPVGGSERDYEVPKPGDPEIVFGTGLGGYMSRFNEKTRQVAQISPWPVSSYAARPTTVKYRYTWITPMEFSPLGSRPMYFGAQVLFKSTNDGDNWKIISPDLSGKKEGSKDFDNPTYKQAYDAGYGVIYTIAPSPLDKNIIWIGTDDGLIKLTTDDGKNWKDVTPPNLPIWARIDAIALSSFSINTAYSAVNMHRLGKIEPLIYKTSDSGKSWQIIINGLPKDEYVNVVRADPVRKGLLYAGTNRSIYVTFDDGKNWQPLTLNFPTTMVRDLLVHKGDLIACTQGRGIWVLDNLEPLHELDNTIVNNDVHLFQPSDAYRLRESESHDTPWPPSTPLGQNPPTGAIVDYWLKDNVNSPIKITIKDSVGNIINNFTSNEEEKKLPAYRYFQEEWVGKQRKLSNEKGMHRFIWNLRYPRPDALKYGYSIAAVWDADTPLNPQGPLVVPGKYFATLTVNGKDFTKSFTVRLDPRVTTSKEDLKDQLDLALNINKELQKSYSLYKKIDKLLKEKKEVIEPSIYDTLNVIGKKGNPNLSTITNRLAGLITTVESADAAPTQGQKDLFDDLKKNLHNLTERWIRIERGVPVQK